MTRVRFHLRRNELFHTHDFIEFGGFQADDVSFPDMVIFQIMLLQDQIVPFGGLLIAQGVREIDLM